MAASYRPPATRVVVVSHLLPVNVSKSASGEWSARWDEEISRPTIAISSYAALGVRRLATPSLFVGSLKIFVPPHERAAVERAIADAGLNCAVVYHDPDVASRFYAGFCKATLWPTMHNVIDVYNTTGLVSMGAILDREERPRALSGGSDNGSTSSSAQPWQTPRDYNPIESSETCWQDYCEVNRALAGRVVEEYQEGDLVWIQHYHLMTLPSYLARKLRNANIGTMPPRPHTRTPARPPARTHGRVSSRGRRTVTPR